MSGLTPIHSDDFKPRVLNAQKPVLVEFGAPWCGPCKMLEPVLAEMAADYQGRVDFYTVDVDQNPSLVMDYGVMGVPTVILFKSGQPVSRLTGYRPRPALEKALFADL